MSIRADKIVNSPHRWHHYGCRCHVCVIRPERMP